MKETTLREILKHNPCSSGLKILLQGLKYSNPVTEEEKDLPIKTLFILENNGYDDCLWSLRCFAGTSNWYRFKADVAESVLNYYENMYPADNRPRLAIEASRNLADNLNNSAARYAAFSAAHSAADSAAHSAADSVAHYAARYAAHYAAFSAAHSAADSAADSVAHYAARYAAFSAAHYAAHYAAFSAAHSAAHSAAEKQKETNAEILKKYIV